MFHVQIGLLEVLSLREAGLVPCRCTPVPHTGVEGGPLVGLCRTVFLASAKVFSSLLPVIGDGLAGCSCE